MNKVNPSRSFLLLSFAITFFLSACDDEEVKPREKQILPVRLEQSDYKRELSYDDANRLSGIKFTSTFPNDVVLESTNTFTYSADGKVIACIADTGFKFEYTYDGNRIVRTDEFINGTFTQYHEFKYDAAGRVIEQRTWQNIPEEGGWVAPAKTVYVYDAVGNVEHQILYYYNSGTQEYKLLTQLEFSDYDDKKEADGMFDTFVVNPLQKLRINNPGKLVIKNMHGNTGTIDTYTYTYNARGNVTKKTTNTTFVFSGQTGTYDTHYYYEER